MGRLLTGAGVCEYDGRAQVSIEREIEGKGSHRKGQ